VPALDVTVLAILALSVLLGLWRGLARTLIGLAGWVGGVLLAARYGAEAGALAAFLPEGIRTLAGMAGVLLATLVVAFVVGLFVTMLLRSAGLGLGDRLLGALFGLARALAILVAVALVGEITGLVTAPAWQAASSARWLAILADEARPLVPPSVMIPRSLSGRS
jgi:membrane protein required for colicin V production